MRKNCVKFKRGQCQRPVEKQSKAFHSTEQIKNAQQTVNNHVRDKIRSNFPLQQMLFLKFSTGFLCWELSYTSTSILQLWFLHDLRRKALLVTHTASLWVQMWLLRMVSVLNSNLNLRFRRGSNWYEEELDEILPWLHVHNSLKRFKDRLEACPETQLWQIECHYAVNVIIISSSKTHD